MNKIIKIIIREILTLLLALFIVMAAGVLTDNSPDLQLKNIKKFEIKLRD